METKYIITHLPTGVNHITYDAKEIIKILNIFWWSGEKREDYKLEIIEIKGESC